jgi:hypothetical protein
MYQNFLLHNYTLKSSPLLGLFAQCYSLSIKGVPFCSRISYLDQLAEVVVGWVLVLGLWRHCGDGEERIRQLK